MEISAFHGNIHLPWILSALCVSIHIPWIFDNNWPAVERNFQRVRGKWGRVERILGREGADKRRMGKFYLVVVQMVLLFGYEPWVLIPGWRRPSRGFTTRQHGRWRAWSPNSSQTGRGCTQPLGRRWQWWVWRRSEYISPANRTWSRNTLCLVLSCTCAWRWSGRRECVSPRLPAPP